MACFIASCTVGVGNILSRLSTSIVSAISMIAIVIIVYMSPFSMVVVFYSVFLKFVHNRFK